MPNMTFLTTDVRVARSGRMIGLPLVRERILREDRLHRALRLAGPAVDALLGVDHEDPLELVDAVDRANIDARA
jgi:hypothetical protein